MKNKPTQICLFLTLTIILIVTTTANLTAASTGGDLQISNLSGTTITLAYDNLYTMPKTTVYAELYCYGSLVTSGDWGGVQLSDLLNQAGLDPTVASIDFTAADGYVVSIPIAEAMRLDVIVAYEKDSAPLSEGLRLVVPEENGDIWIAGITSISMSTELLNQSVGQAPSSATTPATSGGSVSNYPTQQTSTGQQQQTQPKNQTPTPPPIKPVAPANITEPEYTPQPVDSSPHTNGVPVEFEYGVSLVVVVVVLAVAFVVFRRRR